MIFSNFSQAVAKQAARMQKHAMFYSSVDKQALWELYLSSFPEGSDPIYKVNTEHNCNCCKGFIRAVGSAVAIIDGKVESLWDVKIPNEPEYQIVADAMAEFVRSFPIRDVFLHNEKSHGKEKTLSQLLDGSMAKWNHFHATLDNKFVSKDVAAVSGEIRSRNGLFKRGLETLSMEALDTVLELIAQNSIYRGEEQKYAVNAFRTQLVAYNKLGTKEKELFIWDNKVNGAVASIRNTSIGTLLIDLSEGVELDVAIRKYEAVVAPANYKRPTALVTKAMIQKASETLEAMGLTSALQRRYATIEDITINNVLFANRNSKAAMPGNVFEEMIASVKPNVKTLDKIEEVSIERFLSEILPKAQSLEVLMENRHMGNLVSLIAPVDDTAGKLFKWDNNFSWSYKDGLADSNMRQAVVAKGGRVDGVFRFTHQWNYDARNTSLMDLHVFMPGNEITKQDSINDAYGNGKRVGWNNRKHISSGGIQDVDYTSAAPEGYVPVENITFPDIARMPEGEYVCKIHNWSLRNPTQGGFKAEIEFGGNVYEYERATAMKNKEWQTVAVVTLKDGKFSIEHVMKPGASSKEVWGAKTQEFRPVSICLLSPNHWDDAVVGNKHYFFMLEGVRATEAARPFYNEFLKQELNEHRKTFEMVGSKMKVEDSANQLSGLGFSSTQKNDLVVKVSGAFNRTIRITF
jgi:hypothetical protein